VDLSAGMDEKDVSADEGRLQEVGLGTTYHHALALTHTPTGSSIITVGTCMVRGVNETSTSYERTTRRV
jgi:hypothetical protein